MPCKIYGIGVLGLSGLNSINYWMLLYGLAVTLGLVFSLYTLSSVKEKMKRMQHIKEILYAMGDKVSKTEDADEAFDIIISTGIKLIEGACKGSFLMEEEDHLFHFKALVGFPEDLKNLALKKEELFLYQINNLKETAIIVNPVKFDEKHVSMDKINFLKDFSALDLSCTISAPIYIDDKLVGLLNIDSTSSQRIFSAEDLITVDHIKNEFQLVLKNALVKHKLNYLANYDELTALYNRRYFKQLFNRELDRIERYKGTACLVLLDLNDFKKINDTHGHNTGDRALQEFSSVLSDNIRKTDLLARMSGDEFVILFLDCTKEHAVERMERLRKKVREIDLLDITIDFCYGVCPIDGDTTHVDSELLNIADREMYQHKKEKYCNCPHGRG